MREKIVGILGGMGPEATCEIFRRIIKLTEAKSDGEHLRVIIDNNPKIPDRTNAIMNKGISPVDEMIKTAQNIQQAGADFIIVPCITAHRFIAEVQNFIDIPILNGLELTNEHLSLRYPGISKLGLIATTGTISTGLFLEYIKEIKVIAPKDALQDEVMDIIYGAKGIKAGNTSMDVITRINKVIQRLVEEEGIDGVITGCTEIGLVMNQSYLNIPLIDPLTVLAEESVKLGKGFEQKK